jgi:hypothetical protein
MPHEYSDPYFGLITLTENTSGYIFIYRSKDILFPKDDINVCERINLRYKVDDSTFQKIEGRKYEIEWTLYADDMPPKQGKVLFSSLNEY